MGEMRSFRPGGLLNLGYILGSEVGTAVLKIVPLNTGPLLPAQRNGILEFLSSMFAPELAGAELSTTAGLVSSLIGDLQNIEPIEQERVAEKLRTIRVAMQNELAERACLLIRKDKTQFFNNPEAVFPLGFPAFPSAQREMLDACRANACGLPNACVHHCMGILEQVLQMLARHLGVTLTYPLEFAGWEKLLDEVENRIREIERQPRGSNKDEKLRFLSETALELRYFKDAWRNAIAHHRVDYQDAQANRILTHTRDFVEDVAKGGLKEILKQPAT